MNNDEDIKPGPQPTYPEVLDIPSMVQPARNSLVAIIRAIESGNDNNGSMEETKIELANFLKDIRNRDALIYALTPKEVRALGKAAIQIILEGKLHNIKIACKDGNTKQYVFKDNKEFCNKLASRLNRWLDQFNNNYLQTSDASLITPLKSTREEVSDGDLIGFLEGNQSLPPHENPNILDLPKTNESVKLPIAPGANRYRLIETSLATAGFVPFAEINIRRDLPLLEISTTV